MTLLPPISILNCLDKLSLTPGQVLGMAVLFSLGSWSVKISRGPESSLFSMLDVVWVTVILLVVASVVGFSVVVRSVVGSCVVVEKVGSV